MLTEKKMDLKELILELKRRALGGYGLVIAPFPEKEQVVFTYASEGILIMTGQAPIFVAEEVKQIDEKVIDKLEEIAKLETITRVIFGVENGWIDSALVNIENDLYAVPNIKHEDMKEHLYIDDIPLNTEEAKNWFAKFLSVPEKTEFPADLYLFQKATGIWMKTEPKDRVRLFGRGTVDEVLEKEKNRLKDIAFRYPETYAVVKKIYEL